MEQYYLSIFGKCRRKMTIQQRKPLSSNTIWCHKRRTLSLNIHSCEYALEILGSRSQAWIFSLYFGVQKLMVVVSTINPGETGFSLILLKIRSPLHPTTLMAPNVLVIPTMRKSLMLMAGLPTLLLRTRDLIGNETGITSYTARCNLILSTTLNTVAQQLGEISLVKQVPRNRPSKSCQGIAPSRDDPPLTW